MNAMPESEVITTGKTLLLEQKLSIIKWGRRIRKAWPDI